MAAASLLAAGWAFLARPAAAVDIPLTIEELLPASEPGLSRSGAPLRFGVPLSDEAAVDSTTPVSITGLEAPQVRPLARYPNGHWRWMLVETLADLAAGEKRAATLRTGSGGVATGAALAVDQGDAIVVDTGPAQFRIRKLGWNGIDALTAGGVAWVQAGHNLGFLAADSSGAVFRSANDTQSSVVIESNGPLLATVVARGHLRSEAGAALFAFTARLRFARGRPEVELELTLQNAEVALLRPVYFRWVTFELPLAFAPGAAVPLAFGLNGGSRQASLDSAAAALRLYQGRTTYREDRNTSTKVWPFLTADQGVLAQAGGSTLCGLGLATDHLDGWLAAGGSGYDTAAGVNLAVRDLPGLYPTGLRLGAQANGARVLSYDILSPVNSRLQPIVWAWGAHHTGVAVLGFGTSPHQSWAQAQFPVFARPAFEYLRQVGALYGETRLVDLDTEKAWFAAQGHAYTVAVPTLANLTVNRYYHFGNTGGPNQYDRNLTFVIDYLRSGQTGLMLEAMQDAAWKADQAVVHSDDFDYGTRANGETDVNVADPDGWNGRAAGTTFENEHPHWLTLPVLYRMTGNERLREAAVDYCEWRRYRAGNHAYGPIYGKGMSSLRLWSRAWRDIALAWEFTGQQRYYDDLVRMTRAMVYSVEAPGKMGRSLDRGYFYPGDWSDPTRPTRLFFAIEILGTDSHEAYRLLPDGALREDLRDFLTGMAYYTVEARLGAQNTGFTYTYYLDAPNTPGTRGDQIGMLMAHGYEWTGDATFADYGRDLAWRPIVYADWERGSEPAALVRAYTDLHRGERGVGWIGDLQVAGGGGAYTLAWTAPPGAREYIVKYAARPIVPNLWYDPVTRTYRHDPKQYANFWAATNVQGEPAPGPAGSRESMTISGLDPGQQYWFAVSYTSTSPVQPALADAAGLAATYDDLGRPVIGWTLPAGATGARLVRNDTTYAGFAAYPAQGASIYQGAAGSAVDSTLAAGSGFRRHRNYYYTVFATDAAGRSAAGARLAVNYDPPPLRPLVDASAAPVAGEAALEVRFTATAMDPDGDLATTSWDFGEGSAPAAGVATAHTYARAGSFTATFTATDSTGLARSQSLVITVLPPEPPRLSLAASATSGRAPLGITFAATVSDASALAETLWTFAPGDTARATRAARTYTAGGRFVARFRAADIHGLVARDSIVLSLRPPDVSAPIVVAASPAAGATRVPRATGIAAALADTATGVDPASLRLEVDGTAVTPVVAGRPDSLQVRYAPTAAFGYGQTVRVRLRAADRAVTANVVDSTWTFQTDADAEPPRVLAATPAPGSKGAAPASVITVSLADSMSGLDLQGLVLQVNGANATPVVEGNATAATLRYTPAVPFGYGATVRVRLRAADRATIANVVDSTWTFQVRPDATPPLLVWCSPTSGAAPVAASASLALSLTDSLSGIDPTSVALLVDGVKVTPLASGGPEGLDLVYAPPGGFAYAKTVSVRVRAADRNATPNVLDTAWSFRVETAPRFVNFQPATFGTPVGYQSDTGKLYTATVGYGWLSKVATESKIVGPDPRLNSDAYVTNPAAAIWQLALPSGSYLVTLVVGASASASLDRVEIEGTLAVNNVSTTAGKYYTLRDYPVNVGDGFLSVRIGGIAGSSKKTKLCYIDVRSVTWSAPLDGGRVATNSPPVAGASALPGSGTAPLAVQFTGQAQDADGDTLSYVWNFGDGGTSAVLSPQHTYAAAGSYAAILTVTDPHGAAGGDTVQVQVTVAQATPTAAALARVNFQPATFAVPAGYTPDSGELFNAQRGYGWIVKVSTDLGGTTLGPLLDTFTYVTNPGAATWQLPVAPGTYAVTLVVGSPTWTGQHRVEVEGNLVVNDVSTVAGQFYTVRDFRTAVSDGFLTVRIGGISGSSKKTKLCYIDVDRLSTSAVAAAPADSQPRAVARQPGRDPAGRATGEPGTTSLGRALRINFQPPGFEVPAGWVADSGGLFDLERGYGWDREVEADRAHTVFDAVHNSFVTVDNRRPAVFSVLLPNGFYRVSLVAGSPKATAENQIEVEGQTVVRDVTTRAGSFVDLREVLVEVTDGALTVVAGGAGRRGQTKLCGLVIEPAAPEGGRAGAAGLHATLGVDTRTGSRRPAVEIAAPIAAPLCLRIFDVRGRLVRTLWRGEVPAGNLRLEWDGHDESGGTAAAGMYFVRAELGRRVFNQKLLLVH